MIEDAVRVERPAGFGTRMVAAALDFAVVYAGTSLLGGLASSAGAAALWGSGLSFILTTLYFWLLTAYLGRTPGKIVMRIELRHPSGHISLTTAFVREVVGKMVAYGAFFLGVLWIAFDAHKRGWHDMIAGTRAVRVERMPWLAEWDEQIGALLAQSAAVTAAMLDGVPEPWRPDVLAEYARRHPEAAMESGVLRRAVTVELF